MDSANNLPLATHANAFDLARELGMKKNWTPGSIWLPELEVSYILTALRRRVCDDNERVRLRRHILVFAEKEVRKSSTVEDFIEKMTPMKPYHSATHGNGNDDPCYRYAGSGITLEKTRGGVSDGNFVQPWMHRVNWIVATELASFLGRDNEMVRKVDTMNGYLEEGLVDVGQMGFGQITGKRLEAVLDWCENNNVTFDSEDKSMTYNCVSTFIGCSVPYEDDVMLKLDKTGFLSRFSVCHWRASRGEMEEYEDFIESTVFNGPQDTHRLEAELLKFNTYASKCRFKRVNAPVGEIPGAAYRWLKSEIRRIAKQYGLNPKEISNGRELAKVFQLLIAIGAERTIRNRMMAGIPAGEIPGITYIEEDIDMVKHFLERYVTEIEYYHAARAREAKVPRRTIAMVHDYIHNHLGYDSDVDLQDVTFQRKEFIDYLQYEHHLPQSSAYRITAEAVNEGLLSPVNSRVLRPGQVLRNELIYLPDQVDEVLGRKAPAPKASIFSPGA